MPVLVFILLAFAVMAAPILYALNRRDIERRKREGEAIAADAYAERIAARYQRRLWLALHLMFFFFVMIGAILGLRLAVVRLWPLEFIWLGVLLMHGVVVLFGEMRDQAIDREREREYGLSADGDDAQPRMRLGDDGELIEIEPDSDEPEKQSQRHERPSR